MSVTNSFPHLLEMLDAIDSRVGHSDDFEWVAIELVMAQFSNHPKFGYALIEWVAKSQDNAVKRKRKQVVVKALGFDDVRRVERLLKQYQTVHFNADAGRIRADSGTSRIDPYWLNYMENCWKRARKCKEKLRGIDVYRELERHAAIDCEGQDVLPPPSLTTVYRIVNRWIAQQQDYVQAKITCKRGLSVT